MNETSLYQIRKNAALNIAISETISVLISCDSLSILSKESTEILFNCLLESGQNIQKAAG